jgi:hypothetical protein
MTSFIRSRSSFLVFSAGAISLMIPAPFIYLFSFLWDGLLKVASAFFAVFPWSAFAAPMELYLMVFAAFGTNTFNPGLGVVVGKLLVEVVRQAILLSRFH